jgi:ArsR family transcriptional regulator
MGKTGAVKLDEFFAALADRTRLRLLNLMADGEVCVCFFAETIGTNNPKISRHLAYLKRAGLVKSRREGKWMHYSISAPNDPKAADIFESVLRALEIDEEMKADKANLANVCCAPRASFVNIAGRGQEA